MFISKHLKPIVKNLYELGKQVKETMIDDNMDGICEANHFAITSLRDIRKYNNGKKKNHTARLKCFEAVKIL